MKCLGEEAKDGREEKYMQ